MRSIRKRLICSLAMGFLTLATWGCDQPAYDPVGPVPAAPKAAAARSYSEADVDAMVTARQESIYSLAPRENRTPPEACDYIKFMRYRLNNALLKLPMDPKTAEYADAGLLIVPGVLEGANGFEYFARQLVYIAKREYGLNIEVWAMDRRNNCLEDRTGLDAAESVGSAEEVKDIGMACSPKTAQPSESSCPWKGSTTWTPCLLRPTHRPIARMK